jgi:hypothetical protein
MVNRTLNEGSSVPGSSKNIRILGNRILRKVMEVRKVLRECPEIFHFQLFTDNLQ